jgi:omega-hydroxy-beta-dihydromenaquinone-9 sulfotransferase
MDYENLHETSLLVTNTPVPGYTLPNILTLLIQNHFHISPRYLPRFVYSLSLSSIIAPFYLRERFTFDQKIKQTEIKHPPLFLIGHWRSGTTYLHNVLSYDQIFSFFTTFQAYLPSVFLSSEKLFKPIVVSSLPKKRPMDDVPMDADYPQEDQYAIGAMSPYSYYHGWVFPKNMEFYNRYVLMEDVPQKTIDAWKDIYLYLLKKATLASNGRRLLLKNQDNTAKIRHILDMFPEAQFVLIQRNPYQLYYSMIKFMRIVIPLYCLQTPPKLETVERSMMQLYAAMFKKYLKERDMIPEKNLVEITYEDYIQNPLKELKHIYDHLHLPSYTQAQPAFQTSLESQKNLIHQNYEVSEEVRKKVDTYWGFAVKAFGYDTH